MAENLQELINERRAEMVSLICSVENCGKPVCAKTLCRLHWERQHKTGTTDAPIVKKHGPDNPMWKGNLATYGAVHLRMSNGPRPETCDECGTDNGRFEWALKANVPESRILISPRGYKYSADPSDYRNLCKKCHNKADLFKEVCKRGHLLSGENLYIQKSTGQRFCRQCQTMRRIQRTARDKAKVTA